MNALSLAYCYRIVVRGDCVGLLGSLFPWLVIEPGASGTALVALVRDESEFYGLLDRLHELGLHIISLNDLGAAA